MGRWPGCWTGICLIAAGFGLGGIPDAGRAAEIQLFGPSSYSSAADTPEGFLSGVAGAVHVLEDFEDGSLDGGIEIDKGWIINPELIPGVRNLTDSVDGDDGTIDGSGQSGSGGHSWFFTGMSVTVRFAEPVSSAALVWTDGDAQLSSALFEVLDGDDQVMGTVEGSGLADDVYWGTTIEDRFFGARSLSPDGLIHGLRISNVGGGLGIELDHVQYQRSPVVLPEPAGGTLAAVGLAALAALCRPRKRRSEFS